MESGNSRGLNERIAALLDGLAVAGAVQADEAQEARRVAAEVRRVKQRRAWDAANLRTVSTKLTVDEDRRFRRYCKACGMTRYEVLQDLIRTVIRNV